MNAENLISILIPVLVLAVLWTVVRHWILPFVLGFALAVALGPSARPMLESAWDAITHVGDRIFRGGPRDEEVFERSPERRETGPSRSYDPERR